VPDGNTVLFNANAFVINPHLRKLSYDPLTSFEPVCQLVSSPQVMVVGRAAPYRSLTEMFDAARARPGELTLASVGPASTQHIAFEMLKHLAGVNMIFVPFNGNGPAVNALLGKHVDSVLVNYSEVAEIPCALPISSASSRARMSAVPPAANGTMNLIIRLVCACAAAPRSANNAIVPTSRYSIQILACDADDSFPLRCHAPRKRGIQ